MSLQETNRQSTPSSSSLNTEFLIPMMRNARATTASAISGSFFQDESSRTDLKILIACRVPRQVLSADFGLTVLVTRLHHKCRRGGSTATPVGFKIFEQCSWHEELEKTKPHSKPNPSTPQGKHHARWHVFHNVSRNDSINREQFVTTVQEEFPCTSLRSLFRGRVRDKHMMALSISTGSGTPLLEKKEARNFHEQLA